MIKNSGAKIHGFIIVERRVEHVDPGEPQQAEITELPAEAV